MAYKLAGLVTFVANACKDLKPNYPRFQRALGAFGVTTAELDQPDKKGAYITYTELYNAHPQESCAKAKAQFGPNGTTLPDLFELR